MTAPKRDAERMRDAGRNGPAREKAPLEQLTPERADWLEDAVTAPDGNEAWHPVAARWYESLKTSGQSIFYEPSDWALAYLLAESISRDLGPVYVRMVKEWVEGTRDPRTGEYRDGHYEEVPVYERVTMKGASLTAYLSGMSKLLVTERDRREFRIEVERGPEHERAHLASVTDITATRQGLLDDIAGSA